MRASLGRAWGSTWPPTNRRPRRYARRCEPCLIRRTMAPALRRWPTSSTASIRDRKFCESSTRRCTARKPGEVRFRKINSPRRRERRDSLSIGGQPPNSPAPICWPGHSVAQPLHFQSEEIRVRIPPTSMAFTLLLGFLVALPSFGIDMSLPALTATGATLRVAPAQDGLTMSLFMLGFAIAPLLYGPISDRYGRKPVILFACLLFS